MREDRLLWLVERIYNTFGKQPPKQNSGQFITLRDNLADLPDNCIKYITQKATDLDDMPKNLTKFCFACWREWQAENGESGFIKCETCGGTGGWTFFKREKTLEGKMEWHEYFSPCPACTYIIPRLREKVRPCCKKPWELEREGCIIMPHDYPGGVLQFISDNGLGDKVRGRDENPYDKRLDKLMASLGRQMVVEKGVTEPAYAEAWA